MIICDPHTPEEWQEAADAAHFMLALDSARQYGLIIGGPIPKVERCEQILKRAKLRGITPAPLAALIKKGIAIA